MCTLFVQLHEAAVAYNITHYDSGETTRRHPARRHIAALGCLGGVNIANFLAHGPIYSALIEPKAVSTSRKIYFGAHQRRNPREQYQRALGTASNDSMSAA
jgi:hypothetical protein